MSALPYIATVVIPAAYSMLPFQMRAPESKAMLLAIGLQESRFKYRRQIGGPARSFWQAESGGGFRGILFHTATKDVARDLLQKMAYGEPDDSDFQAIEHNDILACCGARLLLWTHPDKLPGPGESERAWQMYLDTWRPGKPHPETWAAFYEQAWAELQRA
jgi:hypothetical protein